ncbi:MAG: cardiolipin synthase [Bacilli bacterium]|nr:cardiolipin synthase [Bacilli bacterium]
MKKLIKILFSRFAIISFLIIVQFLLLFIGAYYLSESFLYVSLGINILGIICLLILINRTQPPSTKVPWVMIITLLPLGCLIYAAFGLHMILSNKNKKKFHTLTNVVTRYYFEKNECIAELENIDLGLANQSRYIKNTSDCPLHHNTEVKYLSSSEETFELMVEKLKGAKHFIFLEYFIIERGIFWDTILEILKEKAKAGLDVRVMYDDVGSISKLPNNYYKILEKEGIKCVPFNKFVPIVSAVHNNRDHRKIMIIDGDQAFNGGMNIADEYINVKKPYGHWKDTNVYLYGEAVKTFTTMFLENWNATRYTDENYDKFMPNFYEKKEYKNDGFVQPFGDGPRPVYDERIGENVYLNIINNAKKYLYITTPYLIIDYHIIQALRLAALRGVDVRIITPHIPDKKSIFWLTRSNYLTLVEAGVKIYEYTPGFIHAKSFVCDDKVGVVGTINLDYRSLSHHFECATWIAYSKAIKDIKSDFLQTMLVSEEITLKKCKKISYPAKLLSIILGLFAPLL